MKQSELKKGIEELISKFTSEQINAIDFAGLATEQFDLSVDAGHTFYHGSPKNMLDVYVYLFDNNKEAQETIRNNSWLNLEDEWLDIIEDDPERHKEKALQLVNSLEAVADRIKKIYEKP